MTTISEASKPTTWVVIQRWPVRPDAVAVHTMINTSRAAEPPDLADLGDGR